MVKIKDEDIMKMEEHFFKKDFEINSKHQKLKKDQQNPRLFICGTNAYNPKCRYYKISKVNNKDDTLQNGTSVFFEKEVSGKGFCPNDPKHNSTFIYAGECKS